MSKSATARFSVVDPGSLSLEDWATRVKPLYSSDEHHDEQLTEKREVLAKHQERLYSSHTRALLVIFQGMDASGKDGAIKHVIAGVNPQGCQVHSFKAPTSVELDHDFLWRAHRVVPGRGTIGIFNRSYYEELIVTRVHPRLLAMQRLPTSPDDDPKFWQRRQAAIVQFEKFLYRQGTDIVKIFLHISKQEQRERLLARFDDPGKHWKIAASDIEDRAHWEDFQQAYGEAIAATATKHNPWYIVPSDDKKNARLIISEILVERIQAMELQDAQILPELEAQIPALKARLLTE